MTIPSKLARPSLKVDNHYFWKFQQNWYAPVIYTQSSKPVLYILLQGMYIQSQQW